MPAPLLETMEFVKWRVAEADLSLLRAVHGEGQVNAVARALISAYCQRIRAKGLPTEPLEHKAERPQAPLSTDAQTPPSPSGSAEPEPITGT